MKMKKKVACMTGLHIEGLISNRVNSIKHVLLSSTSNYLTYSLLFRMPSPDLIQRSMILSILLTNTVVTQHKKKIKCFSLSYVIYRPLIRKIPNLELKWRPLGKPTSKRYFQPSPGSDTLLIKRIEQYFFITIAFYKKQNDLKRCVLKELSKYDCRHPNNLDPRLQGIRRSINRKHSDTQRIRSPICRKLPKQRPYFLFRVHI